MRRTLPLLLLACACSEPSEPHAVVADALALQTALIVVELHPDGTLAIDEISPRPFPFRQPGARFDESRHGARPAASPAGSPGSGSVTDTGTPEADIPQPTPPTPTAGPCAMVVRHGGAEPTVIPVDLGHPGEGGGDVLDRWQHGSVILRAPYFGPGTRYTLVRMAAECSVALAEKEVRP